MSVPNIYAANPIEDVSPNSTKLHDNNNTIQDDYMVKPKAQKNNQEEENEVRTLLNPVLIEAKEDNEFSKFDEDKSVSDNDLEYDSLQKGGSNDNGQNVLDKPKMVKEISTNSVSTLDNSLYDDNLEQENNNKEEKNTSTQEEDKSQNSMNDSGAVRSMRRSFTDADIKIGDKRINFIKKGDKGINFTSSSNIRNIDGKDVVVDRKYRNIINEDDNNDKNDNDRQEFRSINHLLGPSSINRSIELFANKQKIKQLGNTNIENTNFM